MGNCIGRPAAIAQLSLPLRLGSQIGEPPLENELEQLEAVTTTSPAEMQNILQNEDILQVHSSMNRWVADCVIAESMWNGTAQAYRITQIVAEARRGATNESLQSHINILRFNRQYALIKRNEFRTARINRLNNDNIKADQEFVDYTTTGSRQGRAAFGAAMAYGHNVFGIAEDELDPPNN